MLEYPTWKKCIESPKELSMKDERKWIPMKSVNSQLLTHRVPPCAKGHLWLLKVFLVEKKRPQSSQENSQILPCLATSCRRRSCCRENFSAQPRVQGNEERGLGLCASMCTLSVYWLVKRRSQPMIKHGKRRRCCCWSLSLRKGDESREGEFLMSIGSRLEHEGVGEWDFKEGPGEGVARRWLGGNIDVEGNSWGNDVVKSKLNAFVYSWNRGWGDSDWPMQFWERCCWVNKNRHTTVIRAWWARNNWNGWGKRRWTWFG